MRRRQSTGTVAGGRRGPLGIVASPVAGRRVGGFSASPASQIGDFSDEVKNYKNMLQKDENIYVRRYLSNL